MYILFSNGIRNDVANYRASAVAKLFALLICRSMYKDLRGLITAFIKERPSLLSKTHQIHIILKIFEGDSKADSVIYRVRAVWFAPACLAYTIDYSTLSFRRIILTEPLHHDSQCIKRLSSKSRDPYTWKVFYVSLVSSRLEYNWCVWQPFYAVHNARIEWIQEMFVKYASIGLDGMPIWSTALSQSLRVDQ
jgi:hypothetical protein